MADKQQLVYEINVTTNGTEKIEGVKKSLESTKSNLEKLNNTNLKISVNGDFESKMRTLTQDLSRVKRGIELLNKGATITVNGTEQTEQSLRALEKVLEDTVAQIKATSFNNVAKDMAKIDEAAAKDSAAIDKLMKKYEQLTRTLSIAKGDNKLIPESTWYNRRNSLDEVIAKLREYGIVRDNVYRGDSYASYRNSTQAAINDLKRRAELETQIERIIDRQTLAMERGQQVKRADFELSMRQFNQLLSEYQKLGGTKTFTSPFSSFNNSEEQNKAVMQKNLEAWSTGLRTYSQELSRLMALQEQMYVLWRHDGSQEAKQNLDKLAATIAKVRAEQEAYQRTVNTTRNPAPNTPPAQPVDPTSRWAEGIQSYTRELRRLEDVQQRVYALWKSDPTEANKIALDNVKASLASVRKEYESFQKSINGTGANIENTSKKFASFEQKLRSHLYWITAGSLLGAAFAVPTETFNSLVKLDEEMHNLATVMPQLEGKSSEAIAKYQEEQRVLINTAREYGESVKDVMESARLWGRMYKDQATVNTLVSQSAKLAVADNFSMAESTKAVEAAMFQYGMVAKNSAEALAYSNKIVDVYTKLSHNAGVSAQDLADGVKRSGSVAKQAGISFEFLNALIAQGTRATALSGSEIGNMLKTMLASFNSDKAVKELNKLGIATTEVVNGVKRVRSAQAVLMDVAVAAQGTNKNLKDLWIQMSGGKFQWAKAAAMFSNYQEIIKNWGLAVNSMGFTDNQVKNQMDSLSRRINKLKADLTGMVAQGGNSGLTEWLKECVTDLDNLARYLSTVSTSTYSFLGSMVKLAAIMFAVNRAMRMVRTSLNMVTASGATATISNMSAAFSAATTAAGGLKAAIISLKNSISLLKATATFGVSLALDLGIEALTSNTNESSEAINKQTDAMIDNVAAKRQEIEMYSQQEDFLDALFTAHQKLTAEIESSTVSDKKKKKLLEDRIETENQMANVVGWSAVQQMQADNWTDESTKKVRDNYKKATDDKKRALAEFISAKQQEALNNWQNAQDNLNTWKQETYEFCNGISDRIKALGDWANAYTAFYQMKEQFDQAQANSYTKQADELQSKIDEMNDRYNDPDYHMSNAEVVQYRNLTQRVAEMRKNAENAQEDVKGDRYNEAYHAGYDKIIAAADKATQEASNLVSGLNTSAPVVNDPNDLLQKWGSGEGAGGDEYNPTPSGKSKRSSSDGSGHTKKDSKEDWQYGDTTSQMFAELSKKFEATFDTRNGLDIAALSAIVTKLTGINTLEFDGVSDPFGTGGRNTWESGRLFYEKMAPYLAQGLTVPEALGHLTPGITEQEWKTWLNDKGLFLRNHYDYTKNDQRFHDPNEQPGGLYDLGGYSGAVSVDGQSYIGNDSDEAHLWELAVDAAGKARKVKNPLWYWLIMMHESARGKRDAAKRNHNFAGMDGGEDVDEGSDDNFTTKLANTIDNDFDSEPSSPEELANGMYANGYFTANPNDYAASMRGIMSEGLIGQGQGASSDPNGIQSGGYDVDDKSMYGLDSRYITMSGSWDNIENLQPYVRRLLNIIANRYYAATGQKLAITSLTGGVGHSTSKWGHYAGYKADLSIDNNGAVLKDILGDYGVSAAVESGTHYDVSFGQGNDGRTVDSASGPLVGDGTGTEAWNRYHNGPMQDSANNSIRKPSFWNGRKSTLADFTRDQIAETIYDQDRQQKLYEAQKKNIEYQMKIHGNTYELLRANDANEKAYYEAVEKNRKGWMDAYDDLTDSITDYVNEHVEIKNKLDGKNIFDIPQDELRKLADLTGKGDNEFKKFIDNLFKVREQLSNADSKLVELRAAEKIRNGYMKPEQDEDFRLKRLEEWYNRTTSNKTDGEKYMDTHELYQSQIDIYNERLKRQREDLMNIRRRDQEQLEEYYESLDDLQNGKYNDKGELVEKGLAQLNGDNTDEAKDNIAELKVKVKDLKENIDQLSKHGSEDFQKIQKDVEDTEAKIREIAEKDDEVTKNLWSTIESDIDDMFFDIIKQGGSFKESWKKLWDDVAKIALQQIMRMTVNRWLFNARTTIDDAISNRNAGKNAAVNAGVGLASKFTSTPKRWNQVATGNRYLDMANGVTNGNFFPMNSNGSKLATTLNKSVQETSKLSAVTQKATAFTNVSNTLTQAATAKDTLNTSATATNTMATEAQTAAAQANTEAILMSGAKPSISLGGHAMGGLLTTAYANGGMISGAGTGKSDSILAYLADKDRFVFLSNGEYVMTAEATSRIGKDNLDAMNYGAFADGGALNPTPYVPQISPRVAKRAEGVRVSNPNARMEQLMQEQTDTIKNMGNSDTSGNVVVLNTHASSDDVMNAIQRNPRAFQSILHNQKRHGFR